MHGNGILDEHEVTLQMEDCDSLLDTPTMSNHRTVDVIAERLYSRPTIVFGDARKYLGPIMGYANEPLLPLAEACAPLVDIIPDLQNYVQAAVNKTSEQPPNGLTIDESVAIRLYTMHWKSLIEVSTPYSTILSTIAIVNSSNPIISI